MAPLTCSRVRIFHLVMLGLLGGAPAIFGCWLGGFTYSDFWAVFLLAIGAGAIFQVVWAIARQMRSTPAGNLLHLSNAAGFLLGVLVMIATALLVTA